MAEISRKKSIIKKRMTTFHLRPKKQTKAQRAVELIAKPAAYIHKQATSERGKKVISGIGTFLRNWGEAAQAAKKRQYGTQRKRKSTKKKTKKSRRK